MQWFLLITKKIVLTIFLQADTIATWFYGEQSTGRKYFRCLSEIEDTDGVVYEYGNRTFDTAIPLPDQQGTWHWLDWVKV